MSDNLLFSKYRNDWRGDWVIQLGIVGCGGIAHAHLTAVRALVDLCKISVVFDEDASRAQAFAQEIGTDAKTASTADELFAYGIDAVIICTPNHSHEAYVEMAALYRIAVLCEKPLAHDLESAARMVHMVEKAGITNMVGFVNRHQPGIIKMRRALQDGVMGNIVSYMEICSGARLANPEIGMEWRMRREVAGGGAVADFGSHSFDMSTWLLEPLCGPLTHLMGNVSTFIPRAGSMPTNDDAAMLSGRFASGALMSVLDSRVGPGFYRVEIIGLKGFMTFDARTPQNLDVHLYDGSTYEGPIKDCTEPSFVGQMRQFLSAVSEQRPADPSLARGLFVQRMIEKVRDL